MTTMRIDGLRSIDEEEGAAPGDVLLGRVTALGTDFHLYAVRVRDDATGTQTPVSDPQGRLADLVAADAPDAPYATTDLSAFGFSGEYVIYAAYLLDTSDGSAMID